MKSPDSITIKGIITEGLKESSSFTCIPWVREQFMKKLEIDPYPGTLNLVISDREDLAKYNEIKRQKGIEIVPEEDGFCSAKSFPVLIGGKIRGALIIPQVPGYPESKLEVISTGKVKDALSLKTGDIVQIEVFLDK